ncbi:DUF3795 domain-containing protein [Anaerosporobacter sp.]|uniref:DUF3795 domain-containing protein n=1 Tax=Anaerosporobacter sp. TaxID=1872529 RepID=UPI00286F93A7|nr:DUF3795 domain-containing protein [Anaerosporobacter sp.]
MIESRCGIECSKCNSKENFGVECAGCVSIKQPFWGECPVKVCCEGKGLENCGFCLEFPCELLNRFSYDKQDGDDGLRIEQCKAWCKEGK